MEFEKENELLLEIQQHVSLIVDDTPDEVIYITSVDQKQNLINNSKVLIVKLGAEWCGPCEKVMPRYKQLAVDFVDKSIVFASEDVDDELDLNPVPIKTIPVFHLYKNSVYVTQIFGTNLENLETEIKKLQELDLDIDIE